MDSKYDEWINLYNKAQENMNKCMSNNVGCLIEVTAQQSLVHGVAPNYEFQRRLDKALALYKKKKSKNLITKIYIPGSAEKDELVNHISLSRVGCSYLQQKGVPAYDLYGESSNRKYRGDDGVYGLLDECYVTSCIFREHNYAELHSICSSAQLTRKALSYIKLGYIPEFHSISCGDLCPNYIDEVFKYIPAVLEDTCK